MTSRQNANSNGKFDWRYWPLTAPIPGPSGASRSLDNTPHLELVDHEKIEWGLSECDKSTDKTAVVEILDVFEASTTWNSSVDDDELEKAVIKIADRQTRPDPTSALRGFSVFFLNTSRSRHGWLPGNFSMHSRTLRLLQRVGLSSTLVEALFSSEGKWSKMANQCFTHYDDDGDLTMFEMSYRYICGWDTAISFNQLCRTPSQTTYFCINYPHNALRRLKMCLNFDPKLAFREFFVDALSADECMRQWQAHIGERRESLLFYERVYKDQDIDFEAATRHLHTLSYGWSTLSQDCQDQVAQLEFLNRTYDRYTSTLQGLKTPWDFEQNYNMRETFEVLKNHSDHNYRWTTVYGERTNIRINLLFHLATQMESKTSTLIAASSARIAEQTQRDSASMITMAAVTMFFLPGTFISTILSTTFFDYGENDLNVSRKWWILPASAIPTTMAVFGVWLAWRWWRLRQHNAEMHEKLKAGGHRVVDEKTKMSGI